VSLFAGTIRRVATPSTALIIIPADPRHGSAGRLLLDLVAEFFDILAEALGGVAASGEEAQEHGADKKESTAFHIKVHPPII
jgi:hypothetical protein